MPIKAKGQMISVSVGAAPQGKAVIFQRWNRKSCKSISWLRLDGHFWITGLLLSKCGAGKQWSWSWIQSYWMDQHEQHYGWICDILLRFLHTLCWVAQVRFPSFYSGQKIMNVMVRRISFLNETGKSYISQKNQFGFKCKMWNMHT